MTPKIKEQQNDGTLLDLSALKAAIQATLAEHDVYLWYAYTDLIEPNSLFIIGRSDGIDLPDYLLVHSDSFNAFEAAAKQVDIPLKHIRDYRTGMKFMTLSGYAEQLAEREQANG